MHCGPEGIYVTALGNAEGKAPGGIFLMDHESFEVRSASGRWIAGRSSSPMTSGGISATTPWSRSEWGTPDTFENGLVPEVLLGAKYGRRLHFWDLHKRKHLQAIDFGDEYQLVFELRPAHDPTKAYGFVNCVHQPQGPLLLDLDLAPRRREMGGDRRSSRFRPSRPSADQLPPVLKGFKAVPPLVTDIDLSMDDRFLYVSCWGTGDLHAVRRLRPVQAEADGHGADRRHRVARAASRARRTARSNGGPQMVEISRDGRRVYFTNSLYGAIDEQFYPDGV